MSETTLFRPVGKTELALIAASGFRAFPPRLEWQPIFYPVLDESYAHQIARDWNAADAFSGFEGHVTRFRVRDDFLARYEPKTVGAAIHREYWIPAGDLAAFNDAIVGSIDVIASYRGGSTPG
jgi:hypothetical protein